MKFTIFLTVFILVSCATQDKKQEKDISKIKESDFKPVTKVNYSRSLDKFSGAKSELSAALNSESVSRIFKYDGEINFQGELGRVTKLCYERNFNDAKNLIKKLSRSYVRNPIFWNQVGTCYLMEGERRKALLFYNKALDIKKDYAPALNNLGVLYTNEKDFSRALVAFRRAKRFNSFSKTPRYNLANLYLTFGLYDRAISELNVLYQFSKTDVDVLNMLGTSYLMKGNSKKSIEYFSQIEKDIKENHFVGINLALAYYMKGDSKKSISIFEDINSKNLGLWKNYYLKVKDYIGVN